MTLDGPRIAARAGRMLAVLLAACSSSVESPPPAPLLARTDPASTADCPDGGTIVRSGRDIDGDGELQEREVIVRTPVCDPAPVLPPVITLRIVSEPAGPHCSAGGIAVQSGPDENRNGNLDDAEVVHTDYLCRQALVTRIA